ncbi:MULTISPECIES: hypothetical protein [unclassified Corynebacterium]|uniref:hypothetical protein n=1 Tax=unclassified Corynebacterium TaxID=2624378 RepID=UPI0034CF3209
MGEKVSIRFWLDGASQLASSAASDTARMVVVSFRDESGENALSCSLRESAFFLTNEMLGASWKSWQRFTDARRCDDLLDTVDNPSSVEWQPASELPGFRSLVLANSGNVAGRAQFASQKAANPLTIRVRGSLKQVVKDSLSVKRVILRRMSANTRIERQGGRAFAGQSDVAEEP